MNCPPLRANILASFLVFASFSGAAVTFGPTRGSALVGRPLDVTVQARLDGGDDVNALCAVAEVSYGDTRIDSGKVTVRISPAAAAGQVNVRVTSSAVVDEPVVTVNLRAGCSVRNTRRFVLLADLPTDSAVRPFQSTPPVLGATDVASSLPGSSGTPRSLSPVPISPGGMRGSVGASNSGSADASDPATVQRSSGRFSAASPANSNTKRAEAVNARPAGGTSLSQSLRLGQTRQPKAGTPLLRLEVAELLAERVPSLKSSAQLQTLPLEVDSRRAEFSALWRVLNLRPDEVARDLQRLGELQLEARVLRDATGKTQAELDVTREQVKNAEAGRYRNPLVYALAGLLAAFVLGTAYLYYRFQRTRGRAAWWDAGDEDPAGKAVGEFPPGTSPHQPSMQGASRSLAVQKSKFDRSNFDEKVAAAGSPGADSTYPPSGLSLSSRGVNVSELFDIAQQADFFVSLGQHDHAIEVLLNHIRENAQTSPLVYFDLFKLYHDLGRKDDYTELRSEFNRMFNAELPPFDAFRDQSEGLEAYESAIVRIQSLWNTSRVLDVIEKSIFREPGSSGEAFDLEAYRELLLLYSIADELMGPDGVQTRNFSYRPAPAGRVTRPAAASVTAESRSMPTTAQPLKASAVDGRGNDLHLLHSIFAGAPALPFGSVGLDVDLSAPDLGRNSPGLPVTFASPPLEQELTSPPGSAWLDFDMPDIGSESPQAPKRSPG